MPASVDTESKADVRLAEPAREDSGKEAFPQAVRDARKREKALLRKLDLFIAPVAMLTTMISYLDRGNIGFPATQGIIEDIHLVGTQLNVSRRTVFRAFRRMTA